jgi:hypothetical protein
MQPFSRVEKLSAAATAAVGAAVAVAVALALGGPTRPKGPVVEPPPVRDASSALPPLTGEGVTPPRDPEGPVGELRLTVADASGAPVAGAEVEIYDVVGAPSPMGRGRTDGAGVFRTGAVPAERSYSAVVTAPGTPPTTSETVLLPAGKTYHGRVVLKKGTPAVLQIVRGPKREPAAGARVVLKRRAAGSAEGVQVSLPVGEFAADAAGRVTLSLDAGSYAVQAGAPGPPWAHRGFEHPAQTSGPIVVELPSP